MRGSIEKEVKNKQKLKGWELIKKIRREFAPIEKSFKDKKRYDRNEKYKVDYVKEYETGSI